VASEFPPGVVQSGHTDRKCLVARDGKANVGAFVDGREGLDKLCIGTKIEITSDEFDRLAHRFDRRTIRGGAAAVECADFEDSGGLRQLHRGEKLRCFLFGSLPEYEF
jgi:hypothetical protein